MSPMLQHVVASPARLATWIAGPVELGSLAQQSPQPRPEPATMPLVALRSKPRRAATAVSVGLSRDACLWAVRSAASLPVRWRVSEVSAARAEVVIGQHMFYLAQDGRWPRQWAAPPNGLVTVYDGVAIVLVGASSGVVAVQVSPAAAAPAQSGYTELGRRGGSQHAYR
jgi:hypothetical protein